jgi:hypothetical protein
MFYVNVRPRPHSDMRIWAPFWNQGTSRAWVWGPSVALVKLQGSHDSDFGHKGHRGREVLNPNPINQSINCKASS